MVSVEPDGQREESQYLKGTSPSRVFMSLQAS